MTRYELRSYTKKPFRFMSLPAEVRLMVYKEVYASVGRLVLPTKSKCFGHISVGPAHFENNIRVLSYLNKPIRREVLEIMWTHPRVVAGSIYTLSHPFGRDELRHKKQQRQIIQANTQLLQVTPDVFSVFYFVFEPSIGRTRLNCNFIVNSFPKLRRLEFPLRMWQRRWDHLLFKKVAEEDKTATNIKTAFLANPDFCFGVGDRLQAVTVLSEGSGPPNMYGEPVACFVSPQIRPKASHLSKA